jgi:hypothetical protein
MNDRRGRLNDAVRGNPAWQLTEAESIAVDALTTALPARSRRRLIPADFHRRR